MDSHASSKANHCEYALSGLFDQVLASADGQQVSFGQIVSTFRQQAYGPLLLIPSLLALLPIIGAIPGMSILTASLIIFVSAQMLAGRKHPWLPARLREFSFRRDRLERAVAAMRPYLEALDRWTRPRLVVLSQPPLSFAVPSVCLVLALLIFPLALVPWGVTLPALALTILSIGLTIRDGYVLVAGYAITLAALLSTGLIV